MKFKDVVLSEASTEAKVAALALLLDKELIKLADTVLNVKKLQGPQGEQGIQGPKGEQGDRGFDGTNGKDGTDGKDGKDGEDGKQGVGVADAKIDFDGSLVITLTDGTEINAGDVVPLDTAEKIRVIGNGGGTSQSVLDAIDAINAVIATYGTMATQNANAVAITGGSINGTSIGATTPSTGIFTTLTATGQTSLGGAAGSESFRVYAPSGVTRYLNATGTAAGDAVLFADGPVGSTPAVAIYSRSTGVVKIGTRISNGGTTPSGTVQFQVSDTASAVNYVQVTGAATGGVPVISVQGSDSSIAMLYQAKGGNAHRFWSSATTEQFRINHTASSVNYATVAGSAAGSAVTFSVAGTDTNIDLALTPKGTGNVRFGTYTANMALTIQGYIEIKDSGGTVRKLAVIA